MELGRAIFESLAELAGLQAWPVSLVKGSFEKPRIPCLMERYGCFRQQMY